MPTSIMTILPQVCEEIKAFIGLHPAERGGILGRNEQGIITRFIADPGAITDATTYTPNVERINQEIQKWKSEGISFAGFIHSHPPGVMHLSSADVSYAGTILEAMPKLDKLWLPIAMTVPDSGTFKIIPFAAIPQGANRAPNIVAADLKIWGQATKTMPKYVTVTGMWIAGGIAAAGAVAWVMNKRKPKEIPEEPSAPVNRRSWASSLSAETPAEQQMHK